MLLGGRRVRVQLHLALRASLHQVPVRESGAVQVEALEILRCGVAGVRADERLEDRRVRTVDALANLADRLLDERRFQFIRLERHLVWPSEGSMT